VYDERSASFFGDRDLVGTDVGAAFLLLPTLVATAALYGGRPEAEGERDYRSVLWSALLLFVLVVAGGRTGVGAWGVGAGVGAGLVVWLLLPRWRILAPLVAALVLVTAAQREIQQHELATGPFTDTARARHACLDKADWGLWASGSLWGKVAGRGVGTFVVAYDQYRPLETFAASRGDGLVAHARRQLTEVLFERGIIGVLLALAAGAACVAAGVMAARRARNDLDAALGAGLAAGVLAIGVFACFANGAVGFGASVAFWLGVGLLGALSGLYGREAGLSRSAEEDAGRAESVSARRPGRLAAALGLGAGAVVLWLVLGARPFAAEYRLLDGVDEREALKSLIGHYQTLIDREKEFSPNELKYLDAKRRAKDTLGKSAEVDALGAKLPPEVVKRLDNFLDSVQTGRVDLLESAARARSQLRQAAAWSLGDRVWLNAQMSLFRTAVDRFALDGRGREHALAQEARLGAVCGALFTLDLERARFHAAIGDEARAHELFCRYARKNPFAAPDALRRSNTDGYGEWFVMIAGLHKQGDPRAAAWAEDFIHAADTGLRFDPTRYALLAWKGQMLYALGRVEEAHTHMLRAADLATAELAERHPPTVQASLLLDAAILTLPWDPERALGLAASVFMLGVDFNDPANGDTKDRALAIIRKVGPPPRPVVGPPPKRAEPAPAPPKQRGNTAAGG
jgi:hypothetical protein